ncbi:hypothetical protein I4U23_012193 [Adineta vaga]|nr:hypothetical protein I4U23_012193 [Adineta vaga]
MANENEKKLKKALESLIAAVSDTIKNPQNDLKTAIKKIVDENPIPSSSQCRGYLLNAAQEIKADEKDHLQDALHDLKGRLTLLDASQAAWDGNLSNVKTLVENYPRLKNMSGVYGTTLLYSSARNNHINLVKYLVEHGHCSVNADNVEYVVRNDDEMRKATIGSTALHAACYYGRLDIVRYLIQHGGDYFRPNSLHETPIDNGQGQENIRKFFSNFLLSSFSRDADYIPSRTILQEIRKKNEMIVDCFWEYKPFASDQWFSFTLEQSSQLQQSLNDKQLQINVPLSTTRDAYCVSMIKFLRTKRNDQHNEHLAWVRCRGSSLLNFHCFSQWQIMFVQHPMGVTNDSTSLKIYDTSSAGPIQLNSWYNFNTKLNVLFETAINYRRRYLNVTLDFMNNEKLLFDLESFIFNNQQKTIEGFLRWIPKIIRNDNKLTVLDNFQIPTNLDCVLLTIARTKTGESKGNHSAESNQYQLKYENAFENDDLDFPEKKKPSACAKDLDASLHVIQDNLIKFEADVIVVCSSSKYLVESVINAAGKAVQMAYEKKTKENSGESIISIPTDNKLPSKAVYFVPWKPNTDLHVLRDSIETLVSNVIHKAVKENYKSIAFPAIGCGEYGCSVDVVAQTLIGEVQRWLTKYPLAVTFVIQENKNDIYDEFQKHVNSCNEQDQCSITVGKGTIVVEKGNITKQKVDVIIGSSSSENLRQVLLKAGGDELEKAYNKEYQNNPNSLLITTPPGNLPCQRVFFLRWEPDRDPDVLRQSIIDLIWNLIQNVNLHHFNSIAFPAIGCGEHACSVDVVVKTMVREMKAHILKRKLAWTVKFIIQPNQQNIYDEFSRQVLSSDDGTQEPVDYQLPSTWQKTKDNQIRFIVPSNTTEYKSIINDFLKAMAGNCKEIVRLERIQNERWYMQYLAHSRDFEKRLNSNTEKRLYHGCPDVAADAIIQDCFNRSFAGVNGTAYGFGVYFSSNAVYSHGYAKVNSKGERCMFVARVLVGKSTVGNSSMKTRPVGYDSTTDGNHMTVTYHDAQAYAEYIITYK